MVTEEMCVGPFRCRALNGECCDVYLQDNQIICPLTGCTDDTNRQSDVAGSQRYSIRDIFSTTLVTSLMYEELGLVTKSQKYINSRSYESFYIQKLLCKRIFLRNKYFGQKLTFCFFLNQIGGSEQKQGRTNRTEGQQKQISTTFSWLDGITVP